MRRISGNTTGSESEEIRIRPDPGLLATLDDYSQILDEKICYPQERERNPLQPRT